MQAKYVNPFTDFGFKKIFGEEASKPLLMDFLNALLPKKHITDLHFKNVEQLGNAEQDRKAVYDIYCESASGEKFIVELQKAKQNYFKERTVYYSTFPIQEQAEKGVWNYKLQAVYCIGVLDFTFDDYAPSDPKGEVVHTIKLKNQHGNTFYEKLTYIYLEMPNFTLQESELLTRLDKWLYFVKNLEDFQTIPQIFNDAIFTEAFEKAEIARFQKQEWNEYIQNLKVYRDMKNVVDTAFDEGFGEGFDKGFDKGAKKRSMEIAQSLKQSGVAPEVIAQTTGLSVVEIAQL